VVVFVLVAVWDDNCIPLFMRSLFEEFCVLWGLSISWIFSVCLLLFLTSYVFININAFELIRVYLASFYKCKFCFVCLYDFYHNIGQLSRLFQACKFELLPIFYWFWSFFCSLLPRSNGYFACVWCHWRVIF